MRTIVYLAFALASIAAPFAGADDRCGAPCNCEIRCPRCRCCVPEVEVVKLKKECFEVECVPICIPRITFPWERIKRCKSSCGELCCQPPKCAHVRNVRVLVVKEYECHECAYSWTPVCCDHPGCGHTAGGP
jgi:hypothetical protein